MNEAGGDKSLLFGDVSEQVREVMGSCQLIYIAGQEESRLLTTDKTSVTQRSQAPPGSRSVNSPRLLPVMCKLYTVWVCLCCLIGLVWENCAVLL